MKDNYDFSDAVKNPFAGKFKGKYIVKVDCGSSTEEVEFEVQREVKEVFSDDNDG